MHCHSRLRVVADFGSVWTISRIRHECFRIDPKTNSVVSTVKLLDELLNSSRQAWAARGAISSVAVGTHG